jgi:predicted RecA/RadA family phage recombinase
MKNFIAKGIVIDVVLAAIIASGGCLLVGKMFGVAQKAGAIGDTVGLVTEGVFDLPYSVAATVGVGDAIYWDDTAKNVTKTVGSNVKIGYAVAAAASSAALLRVKIYPV